MTEIGVFEVALLNTAIILIVITNSIFMYFTLKIYTLNYFLLLVFCSLGALTTNIIVLIFELKLKAPINIVFLGSVSWIFYTQSYLLFLTSYYKDLLHSWQTGICLP
jgi:hypothetical protein